MAESALSNEVSATTVLPAPEFGQTGLFTETINGKQVTTQYRNDGKWVCVQNYEHYGGTNPSVAPADTFPQLPNGLSTASDIESAGSNGELRHVDNIDQYGSWSVDAVRLEATTTNHSRKIHFKTTNQAVINAVFSEQSSETNYTDFQGSTTTLYDDHTANLPASAANGNADTRSDRIFGSGFPFYNAGKYHWAVAGMGNRWEVDDFPGDASNTTVHRVWVRVSSDTTGGDGVSVDDGDVNLYWTNNDDSSDGGIDVERLFSSSESFAYQGSTYSLDVSNAQSIDAVLNGAGGESTHDTTGEATEEDTAGGAGGYVETTLDVSGLTTVTIWVAESPTSDQNGGWGWANGGAGADPGGAYDGGEGAGATAITDEGGNVLAVAGGGGGGWTWDTYTYGGGGGGAPCGAGGPGVFGYDGSPAECPADAPEVGGDGGGGSSGGDYSSHVEAEDGDGAVVASNRATNVTTAKGGGESPDTDASVSLTLSSSITVASGLAPSTTSYTDTSVSEAETYEYRVERNTDHATATSGTATIRAPKRMTRSSGLSADAALEATRSGTSKTRTAALSGEAAIGATRTTAKQRASMTTAEGTLASSRSGVTKPRTSTSTADAALDATRSGISKVRTSGLSAQAALAVSRSLLKHRTTGLSADASLDATRSGVTKPRSSTLTADGAIASTVQFRAAFPSELTRDLAWDYDTDRLAFVSEWTEREAIEGHGSVAVYIEGSFGDVDPCTPTAIVEVDHDGDGVVDEQSAPRSVDAPGQAVVFPDLRGRAGQYRIVLRDLRPRDYLTAVIVGPTHT